MRGGYSTLLLVAVFLSACGQPTVATSGASPSLRATSSQAATAAPPDSSGAAISRCATAQLQFTLGGVKGAAGNELVTVSLTNRSGSTCYLGGYAGVEIVDASGHHLQDAQRSTDSMFGPYPPPQRVDIPPGGTTTFDLSWGGIDPCGPAGPAQRPASFRITPPGDFDTTTVPANGNIVCPNSLEVHPVGSVRQG